MKISTDSRISWTELKDHEYLLKTDVEKLQNILATPSICESQVLSQSEDKKSGELQRSLGKNDLEILDFLERRAEEYDQFQESKLQAPQNVMMSTSLLLDKTHEVMCENLLEQGESICAKTMLVRPNCFD